MESDFCSYYMMSSCRLLFLFMQLIKTSRFCILFLCEEKKNGGSLSLMSSSLYAMYQALFLWIQEDWHSRGNRFFSHSFPLLSATVLGPGSAFSGLSSAQCQYLFDQYLTLWFCWWIAFQVLLLLLSLALSCRCPSLLLAEKMEVAL